MKIHFQKYYDLIKLYEGVSALIENKQYGEALAELSQVSEHYKTEKYYIFLNQIHLIQKNYESVILNSIEAIKIFPFSYEIHYQMHRAYKALGDYSNAATVLAYACRYSHESNYKQQYTDELIELISENSHFLSEEIKRLKLILGEGDECAFPMDKDLKSWINRSIVDNYQNEYLSKLYKSYYVKDIEKNSSVFFKTETIKGKYHKYFKLAVDEDTILPITIAEDTIVTVKKDNETAFTLNKDNLEYRAFSYILLAKGNYVFKSQNTFFVGTPVRLNQKENNKLILTIFIDGLSQHFLEERGLANLMPNTAEYFKSGYYNTNCYSTGDWTYPSVASMFTRKTTLNHKVYHPNMNKYINENNEMFITKLNDLGYYTGQINNNWRITPSSGYVEGFERTLFQNYRGGFGVGEVLKEAREHLLAFKGTNQYLWIGIEDLHDIAEGSNTDLLQQTSLYLENRLKMKKREVSVHATKSEDKIIQYANQLNYIDMYLGEFYSFLKQHFNDSEVTIAIISDHGQGFLLDDQEFLHEARRKVPFLLQGPQISNLTSDELMSITDIFPNLTTNLGYPIEADYDSVILKDFNGLGREFTMTETLHPQNPYRLVITKGDYLIRIITEKDVNYIGLINFEKLNIVILDKRTMEDVTESRCDLVEWAMNYLESKLSYCEIPSFTKLSDN